MLQLFSQISITQRGSRGMQGKAKIHPLQQARKRLGIKQNVLADLTGLSTPTIKRAEHGDPLSMYSVSQICEYFSMRYRRKVEPQELGLHCQWESEDALNNVPTQEQSTSMPTNQVGEEEPINSTLSYALSQLGSTKATLIIAPSMDLVEFCENRIALLENEMILRWMLYYTGGANRASLGLNTWLQEIIRNAQLVRGTTFFERMHFILCMSYQIQGCILRDLMHFPEAHQAFRKALLVAQELHSPELVAATLAREGVTFTQEDQPTKAIDYFQRALEAVKYLGFITLEGYIFQALSEAQAKNLSQLSWSSLECAENLLDKRKHTQEHSLAHFNAASVLAQKGVNMALLHDYKTSIKHIDTSLRSYDATLARGRARLIMQKAEACWAVKEMDACILHTQEAFLLAHSVGASKTIMRAKNLHTILAQSSWRKERGIIELSEIISIYQS